MLSIEVFDNGRNIILVLLSPNVLVSYVPVLCSMKGETWGEANRHMIKSLETPDLWSLFNVKSKKKRFKTVWLNSL